MMMIHLVMLLVQIYSSRILIVDGGNSCDLLRTGAAIIDFSWVYNQLIKVTVAPYVLLLLFTSDH